MSHLRVPRIVALVALVGSLALSVGVAPVAAASPSVTANPTVVPFGTTPGQPGTTQVAVTSDGTTAFGLCVSDNGVKILVATLPSGQGLFSISFPFIQAGTYTFFASATSDCATPTGTVATVQRAGPNGLLGADDLKFVPNGDLAIAPTTTFPISGQICIMSGNGAQKSLDLLVGQDNRATLPASFFSLPGLGTAAIDTTINGAVLGQNGCYPFNAIVNGFYRASFGSATQQFVGFCSGANMTNIAPPTGPAGRCAQIAYAATAGANTTGTFGIPGPGTANPAGATITGAAVTGIDAHAIEACVSAFSPRVGGGANDAIIQVANTVNAYNASGAVNLTPLLLNFPTGTVVEIQTYDITNPGQPGGTNGAQFVCPPATATQTTAAPFAITAVTTPAVANAALIDQRFFLVG